MGVAAPGQGPLQPRVPLEGLLGKRGLGEGTACLRFWFLPPELRSVILRVLCLEEGGYFYAGSTASL